MKSELELVQELKEYFDESLEVSNKILGAPVVQPVNLLFFTHKKELVTRFVAKLTNVYEELKEEKLEKRVMRCLGNPSIKILSRIIKVLERERDHKVESERIAEELKQIKLEAEKVKQEKKQHDEISAP